MEDWDISTIIEREISLNKVPMNFTYWDYINAFDKVLYYNNERHMHTWFINICAKIFAESIPNWFLNWWSYHGPTIRIFPDPFLKLYKGGLRFHQILTSYTVWIIFVILKKLNKFIFH